MTSLSPPPLSVEPFDAAVIIPTVLRPSLMKAVRSVFEQDVEGRIQILIGVDLRLGDPALLDRLRDECPHNMRLTVVDPGYSTSQRNGGLHISMGGGVLRTLLSFAAHSRCIAFLDDDDRIAPDHLKTLLHAVAGCDFAYSRRVLIEPNTEKSLEVDIEFSTGIKIWLIGKKHAGAFFVDVNSVMIDKIKCRDVLDLWLHSPFNQAPGYGEDRIIARYLYENHRGAATGKPTSFYTTPVYYAEFMRNLERKYNRPWVWDDAFENADSRRRRLLEKLSGDADASRLENRPPPDPAKPGAVADMMTTLKPRSLLILRDRHGAVGAACLAEARRLGLDSVIVSVDAGLGDLASLRRGDDVYPRSQDLKPGLKPAPAAAPSEDPVHLFLAQTPGGAWRRFFYHALLFDAVAVAPLDGDDPRSLSPRMFHNFHSLIAPPGAFIAFNDDRRRGGIALMARFAPEINATPIAEATDDPKTSGWAALRKSKIEDKAASSGEKRLQHIVLAKDLKK